MHGTDGTISQLEKQRLRNIIELVYRNKHAFGAGRVWAEFPPDENVVLQWQYDTQMTFIERLKYLYPDVMKMIVTTNDLSDRVSLCSV